MDRKTCVANEHPIQKKKKKANGDTISALVLTYYKLHTAFGFFHAIYMFHVLLCSSSVMVSDSLLKEKAPRRRRIYGCKSHHNG